MKEPQVACKGEGPKRSLRGSTSPGKKKMKPKFSCCKRAPTVPEVFSKISQTRKEEKVGVNIAGERELELGMS